jgi:hypothetical protein
MKKRMLMGLLLVGMMAALIGCGNAADDSSNETTGTDQTSTADSESNASGTGEASKEITAKADENGNYVVNGGFEDAELTGWTVNNVDNDTEELGIYTRETDCHEGVQSLHFYSTKDVNFTAEQTITGLEEGKYKLTAYVQGDTAGDANSSVYFYAVVNGETIKADTSLSGYLAWNKSELGGLNVTDGKITIGVSVKNAPKGWGTIDNITLVKE